MTLLREVKMSLSDLGLSRLFTAHLAKRWAECFGLDEPVTLDDLLSDEDTALYLRRAAGADINSRHLSPRTIEQRAFNRWFTYFKTHPIPTHDGRNDLIIIGRENAWQLTHVKHAR